jgi:UDP-N-acetylglucosamine 2-epimerase
MCSFERTMLEEFSQIVTDGVADFLFVSQESGKGNLLSEGSDPGKIFVAGNVMIDSLPAPSNSPISHCQMPPVPPPPLWDSDAAHRIVSILRERLGRRETHPNDDGSEITHTGPRLTPSEIA